MYYFDEIKVDKKKSFDWWKQFINLLGNGIFLFYKQNIWMKSLLKNILWCDRPSALWNFEKNDIWWGIVGNMSIGEKYLIKFKIVPTDWILEMKEKQYLGLHVGDACPLK